MICRARWKSGKHFVTAAIAGSYRIGKHFALGIFDREGQRVAVPK